MLQKVFIVLSILVGIYVLITDNYTLFPVPSLLLLLSVFSRGMYDFKEGRKAIGSLSIIIALILTLMFIYVL